MHLVVKGDGEKGAGGGWATQETSSRTRLNSYLTADTAGHHLCSPTCKSAFVLRAPCNKFKPVFVQHVIGCSLNVILVIMMINNCTCQLTIQWMVLTRFSLACAAAMVSVLDHCVCSSQVSA